MVDLFTLVMIIISTCSVCSQELPKRYLNIGVILEPNDDISRKVISLAVQKANSELAKYNYFLQMKTETLEENSSFYAIRKACNLLQEGIVAMISPIAEVPSRHISSLCNKFHIPHLVTSCRFPESLENYPMDITVSPNCDLYTNIIYHYITQVENWKDMILIHSTDNCILKFEHLLNQFDYQFIMRQWVHNDLERNKQMLREVSKMKKYRYFLVDIPYWQITDFLTMASVLNMIDPQYSFLFTDWDTNLLNMAVFKINNKVNITTFSIIDQQALDQLTKNYPNMNSALESIIEMEKSSKKADIKTRFMAKPAILFDSISLLTKGLIDLMKTRSITVDIMKCSTNHTWALGSNLLNTMTSVGNLQGITGKLVFNENARRKIYNVSIMELTESGFLKGGHWSNEKFQIYPKEVVPEVVIKNESFKVTTIVSYPFMFYKEGDPDPNNYDTSLDSWSGFCADLLREIGRDLELKFTIQLVKDNKYGQALTNETNPDGSQKWNGMVGELMTKQAQLAVAPMTISYERERVIDFTTPFMSFGLSILTLRPQMETPSLLFSISPMLWVYIISAYVGVSIIIFFIAHITPYELLQIHPCDDNSESENQFNLLNSLWFTFGGLMRKGMDFGPHALSTRIVSGAWWFFTLIIISTYTANLFGLLIDEHRLILPIKSIEDLAKQTQIKYGILKGGSSYLFFEKALIETYQKMFKFMSENPDVFVDTTENGVKKVLNSNGKYAFLLESPMNDYYAERNCSLMRIGDLLDSKGYGIGFKSGSPLRDVISQSILKLQKAQIIPALIHRWWKEYNITASCDVKGPGNVLSPNGPLVFYQIGWIFILLLAGFILAGIVSVIEVYVNFRRKRLHLKMSFCKYLTEELKFAMQFICSSKKPMDPGISQDNNPESPLLLDNQPGTSHALSNLNGETEKHQSELNSGQLCTDTDSPCIDQMEGFNSSHDAQPITSNSS